MADLETKALLEHWFSLDADERSEFLAALEDEQCEALMRAVAEETGRRFNLWPVGRGED